MHLFEMKKLFFYVTASQVVIKQKNTALKNTICIYPWAFATYG